ncbi:MAG: hypothetical protein WC993_09945 [Methanoculleus sp.]|jgi:hypothetical protein|nr:hypothetical protein [Methanomicrobiales archaeon]
MLRDAHEATGIPDEKKGGHPSARRGFRELEGRRSGSEKTGFIREITAKMAIIYEIHGMIKFYL